jgi:uncharacterized membrane protein YccC
MTLIRRVKEELADLFTIRPTTRPWTMPVMAAFSIGIPVAVGTIFGDMQAGVTAALGSFVFLYLPEAGLERRFAVLVGCAFGIISCFALGLATSHWRPLAVPMIGVVATIVTMLGRRFNLPRPTGLFFIMVTAIGAYTQPAWAALPPRVGLVALGTMSTCLIGMVYALIHPASDPVPSASQPANERFEQLVFDPVIIGIALAVALGLAQLLGLAKPYWAPVACLSVVQGISLRAVWTRPFHRTFGTCVGLGVAGIIFSLPLNGWSIAATLMVLTFLVESAIVRNYGFASIFTTPLALLLAEVSQMALGPPYDLMQARLLDSLIGVSVGLVFGHFIHHSALRQWLLNRFPGRPSPSIPEGSC